MGDFIQDGVHFLRPDEGVGFLVVHADLVLDGGDQFEDAVKDAARAGIRRNQWQVSPE